MSHHFPNRRIQTFEKERLAGLQLVEDMVKRRGTEEEWLFQRSGFEEMTLLNFVRDYCQQQINLYHRYDMWSMIMPKKIDKPLSLDDILAKGMQQNEQGT